MKTFVHESDDRHRRSCEIDMSAVKCDTASWHPVQSSPRPRILPMRSDVSICRNSAIANSRDKFWIKAASEQIHRLVAATDTKIAADGPVPDPCGTAEITGCSAPDISEVRKQRMERLGDAWA